jgi:hypothetical protein
MNKIIIFTKSKFIVLSLMIWFLYFVPTIIFAQNLPKFTVFLIGNVDERTVGSSDSVLITLQSQFSKLGKNSSVIFLGDNVYPNGLVDEDDFDRKPSEERLKTKLNIFKNYEGKPFIIPGNYDWQHSGKNGWQYVKNQEKFISEYLQNPAVFFPKGGCPTPHEVTLRDDLMLVLLDTQWWLHPWEKPGETSDCEVKTLEDMLTAVNDILDRNQDKKVLVLGHHPMYSHGIHGGYFTLDNHIFPLKEIGVSIPLPIVGSLYPLYRTLIGNNQDIAQPKYRQMRDGLVSIFNHYPNVLYGNGHDNSLQLIVKDSVNYITSGAGAKTTPVKMKNGSQFASSTKGFARLDFFDNEISLSFWQGNGHEGTELYRKALHLPTLNKQASNQDYNTIPDGAIPNPVYGASKFKKWILGKNYRDIWTTPIKVPLLNFQTQEGGLKVIQKGGGFQTLSLRYQSKDSLQFVTRSVEKYPAKAVPESLRSGFTEDIVSDQISASHPFAALVVAHLAETAGVLHTNPRLVIIPEDTTLHSYKRLFSHQLALFEERPDGGFAGSKKIQSTQKVVEKLAEDNHNIVDEKAVILARIFDMWIGDWDRHDDQWRWAGYENGKGMTYKPIPRDRDQAFFVNQGILPKIVSRKWILPKIQGFDEKIRDVSGLAFNARYFDRYFITKSSENEWLEIAEILQRKMTDAVIDNAVAHFPNFPEYSKGIAQKLKKRREDLKTNSQILYRFLSKQVDVLGSNKNENIIVKRSPNGDTEVSIYDQKKDSASGRLLYNRTFNPSITKEIRIWGLDGEDNFTVSGIAKTGIKVRLIGGKGKDSFSDSSVVRGGQKKTIIYDKIEGTKLDIGSETKNLVSDNKNINDYNREAFNYDVVLPLASFAYNPDDGIFIGAGVQWTHQGFRKSPFASRQSISGNIAFTTGSANFFYKGEFTDVIGKTDFELKATAQQGGLIDNFFGLSNESIYTKEKGIDFYRIRYENQSIHGLFKSQLGPLTLSYGPALDIWDVRRNATKFINEYLPLDSDSYNQKTFLGVNVGLLIDKRNNPILTTHGYLFNVETIYQKNLNSDKNEDYLNLKGNLSLYYTFKLPAIVTISSRFGGGINLSDFEIYQANTLGGLSNLRGFRRSRFSGKSSFYNNTEIRLKLFNLKTYLFPAYMGVHVFNDVGRVWNPQENSDKWHHGYGAGLWFTPFNMFTMSASYGISEEDKIVSIKAGMFF